MKISKIEAQKRRPGRYSIFLDGLFYCGIDAGQLVQLSLKTGQDISQDELRAIDAKLKLDQVRNRALKILAIRLNSEAELKRKLLVKNFDSTLVEETLDWLRDKRLVDDREFASRWLEQRRAGSGYADQRIIQELQFKGIAREILEALDRASADDELDRAKRFLARKFGSQVRIAENLEKAKRALASRGFSYDIIRQAVSESTSS